MKKFIKYISTLTLCFPLFSCGIKKNNSGSESLLNNGQWFTISSTYEYIETATKEVVFPFNTVMSLKYFKNYNNDYISDFNNVLSNLYLNKVKELHQEFDRHYDYLDEENNLITNIKTINDSYATGEEIVCSKELYDLLKLGYELTLLTNGYFNFFIGGLTSFWDNILSGVSYEPSLLYELDPLYNIEQYQEQQNLLKSSITLDEVKGILTFNDEKRSIIFNSIPDKEGLERSKNDSLYRPIITSGGIAKGFATDILKKFLQENNYYDGILNSGSSSITSLSDLSFSDKGNLTISIKDPRIDYSNNTSVSINLVDEFNLSTSGNYTSGKSYSVNYSGEKIYRHHIINPYTGDCSQYHASVTLISNSFSNGELDALSTCFVNLDLEQAIGFKNYLLELYSDRDLNLIIIDVTKDNKLKFTISEELKSIIKIDAKDSIVNYE